MPLPTSSRGAPPAAPPCRRAIPRLRWVVAGTLFLASALNYVDRQALSVLASTIQRELGLDDRGYARVGQAFLLCYALAYLPAGLLVDRVGPRVAQALFIGCWSIANWCTAAVGGLWSLIACRAALGACEPGNYPAAARSVAQWFPPAEKGLAVGLYMMGGTVGAAVTAPLVAWIASTAGWRWVFVATGVAGVLLAMWWAWLYREPARHPRLGDAERSTLAAAGVLRPPRVAPVRLRALLRERTLWTIVGCRLLTDPVWYFYLVWFAKYLQDSRGFTLGELGATLWIVFVAADVGCILGGWASRRLARVRSPIAARMRVMAVAALVVPATCLLPLLPGSAAALAAAALAGCGIMVWMSGAVTLVVDCFGSDRVGRAQGLIGTAGAIGGFCSTGVVGWLVSEHSYGAAFAGIALLHPLALILLLALPPRAPGIADAGAQEPR